MLSGLSEFYKTYCLSLIISKRFIFTVTHKRNDLQIPSQANNNSENYPSHHEQNTEF